MPGIGRFVVPLNVICSRKCETPFKRLVSYSEPASTRIRTLAARVVAWGTNKMRRPFGKVIFLGGFIAYITHYSVERNSKIERPGRNKNRFQTSHRETALVLN